MRKPVSDVRLSKTLALVLRHDPARIGVSLDRNGWVRVDTLVAALRRSGLAVTVADVERVVDGNDKKRFVIDGGRIRASQGHSLDIDLGLEPVTPLDGHLFYRSANGVWLTDAVPSRYLTVVGTPPD